MVEEAPPAGLKRKYGFDFGPIILRCGSGLGGRLITESSPRNGLNVGGIHGLAQP